MASGDNVDVIEVVETSFGGPTRSSEAPSRTDDSGDEDGESMIISKIPSQNSYFFVTVKSSLHNLVFSTTFLIFRTDI